MSGRKITLVESPAPFKIKEQKVDGVVRWDLDNAYPTRMERIIDNSVTAKTSAGMLKRFITGQGFKNKELNEIIVGRDIFGREFTLYEALSKTSHSVAYFYGFYYRIQYDRNLNVTGLMPEKIKNCRFGKMDTAKVPSKVILYNNWDRQQQQNYMKADWIYVDIYNSNKKVIEAQIKASEAIAKWNGQMYFWFDDTRYVYPVSPIDEVQYDADTEKQISLFRNGELRRGFNLKHIIHHTAFDNPTDQTQFEENLAKMFGGEHEVSAIILEAEFDEEGNILDGPTIKVDELKNNIDDKIFSTYETGVANNIRKSFNSIPQVLIDYEVGKLSGTSGEAIRQAVKFYNGQTQDLRKNISISLKEIFQNWKDPQYKDESFEIETLDQV